MDKSVRRLGQLLVVMGALLGAVLDVALALIVNYAESSGPVAASGREVAAAVSTSPPVADLRAPEQRALKLRRMAARPPAPGAESPGQVDQQDGKADKHGEGRPDKPYGHNNDKPNKGKDK